MPVIDVRDGHSSGEDGNSLPAFNGGDQAGDSSRSDRKAERRDPGPGGKVGSPDTSHTGTSTGLTHNPSHNGFSTQTSRDTARAGHNNQDRDHATTDTPGQVSDADTGTTKDAPTAKRRPSLREKFTELRLKAEEKKLNNHQGEDHTTKADEVGSTDHEEPSSSTNNSPTYPGKLGNRSAGGRTRWIGSHLYRPRRLSSESKSQAEEMDTSDTPSGDQHDNTSPDNVSDSTSGVSRNSSISSTSSTLSSGSSRPFIFTSTEERLRAREEQSKEEQLRASPKPATKSDTSAGKSTPESSVQDSPSKGSKIRTYLQAERQKIAEETNMPENSRARNVYSPDTTPLFQTSPRVSPRAAARSTPPFQPSPRQSPRAATRSGIRTPLFQTSPRESPQAAASGGIRTPPFQGSPRQSPRAATRSGIRTPLFQSSPRESPQAAARGGFQTPPFHDSPRESPRAATSSGTQTFRQTLQEDLDDGDDIRPRYGFAASQNSTFRASSAGARTGMFGQNFRQGDREDTSRTGTRTSFFRQNLKEDLDDGYSNTGTRTNVFRETLKEDLDDRGSSGTRSSNFRRTFKADSRQGWGPSATEFLQSLYENQDVGSDSGRPSGFNPNVQEARDDRDNTFSPRKQQNQTQNAGDNTFSPRKQQNQTQNGKYINNQDQEPDFDFPEESDGQVNVVGMNNGLSYADLKRTDVFVQLAHTYLKHRQFEKAVEPLSKAIELCPTCASYYSNRAACYIMLGKFREGLEDARQTTRIDPNFLKGYMREAKCLLMLGDPSQAISTYQKVLQLDPNNQSVADELKVAQSVHHFETQAEGDMKKGDFRRAVFCLDRALDHAPQCTKFKIKKAEALALLGRHTEAHDVVSNILHVDNMNVDAMYVRGLCLYYQDNLDKAFAHFQQVLRLSPDHEKAKVAFRKAKSLRAKKEEGNSAFKAGRYQEAYDLYSEALRIDPHNVFINSKLYNNRATVGAKVNKLDQAIQDCTEAIKLDDNYLKAYLRRAKCYMDTEQYEEAVRDYEKVFNMERTREHKQLLSNAKLELKKSKRKDYYKILGVRKDASDDEIKKAYKKKALETHPDRHSSATPEEKAEQEKKFKEIGEAYATLSDSKKRVRYDNGQDIDDMDSPFSHDFDPNTIFQAFFGGGHGGGGQHFSFGGPGGGMGGPGGNPFGPGFTFQFG
ncbi:PREDICTED: dentin sialophosphoprotein-like isoform X2 [Branchiostoma belcheri]|uniref:Dentin sialophosphoprotein-like isoform X1 n=1 Tax=Branchiostoma belcheri TaxID=7741 RepID=A0A6P4XN35_BRABE|nr:PREDICTED: dentin sialophosphoprotein-like isoform X1 [Branchiostoma belcheri]XP_019618061.1 PREDICTED: dentin sialophosphoprotein-like isoform X2 [Branchiostoma belcheri]